MAFLNPSNQLLQVDTGNPLSYLFNPASSAVSVYANIGESQVLGQRYYGATNVTIANPFGAPAIYMLAKMLPTSAVTLAAWQTANAPAPVYWTDTSFTTVTPIMTEGLGGTAQSVAGYWLPNFASLPNLTLAQLLGSIGLVQVAGYLPGAYGPTTTPGINNNIVGSTGSFTSTAAATAPATRQLAVQLSTIVGVTCNVLVMSDIL